MNANLRGFYTQYLITILTATALFAPNIGYANGPSCATIFEDSSSATWRQSPDLFMGFRSNAPHYWNWLRSQTSSLFAARGVVTGDPNILNFGDVQLQGGGRKYSLIDVDDSGVNASLVGDFLRNYVGNRISPFKVDKQDLFQAYLDGLNGKKMDKPEYLKSIEAKSDQDFAAHQDKYLAKITSNDRFNESAGLQPLEGAPADVQYLLKQSSATFRDLMKDYQILDSGFKIKTSGGSQGLVRFWFLLETNGKRHVWEFKLETDPATSSYTPQPEATTRFQDIAETYRPSAEVVGPFQFVKAGRHVFLLRERLANFMDLDPSKINGKKDIKDGQQMSLYLANKIGRWQSEQAGSGNLLKTLSHHKSFEEFDALAEQYIQMMQEANK